MKITETGDIWDVAVEDALEFTDPSFSTDVNPKLRGSPVDRPVITLGKPSVWRMSNPPSPGESSLKPSGEPKSYFLIRLAFSMRVFKSPVEKAELNISLLSNNGILTAYDMYPRSELKEEKTSLSLAIGPEISFSEAVKISTAKAEAQIDKVKVIPVVQALGIGESHPSWLFEKHDQYPLKGTRITYLIVECPEDAENPTLSINAEADVRTRVGLFRAKLTTHQNNLTWSLE